MNSPYEFMAYAIGLCRASACTSIPDGDAIAARMNAQCPTGIASAWTVSGDATFAGGEPMPCVCPEHPTTHRHWLLDC